MKCSGKLSLWIFTVFLCLTIGAADCSALSLWDLLFGDSDDDTIAEIPSIGDLSVSSYGPDFISIKHEFTGTESDASAPDTLAAYIGQADEIAIIDDVIQNFSGGPLDLSSGICTFDELERDETYRIIVVAVNSAGSSMKDILPQRAEYKETEIDLSEYLDMSEEEIGQLKWALKVADDDLDDFSRIPSLDILGLPMTGLMNWLFCSYRYTIAFYSYYLATVQYHKIPACQEIIQPRMDRLIRKMQRGPVWKYWALTSTGYITFPFGPLDPDRQIFYPSERDPVRVKNIMYSGHLAQMIALYEKLYEDMKYCESGAIEFKWSFYEKYTYNTHSLHKLIRDAFLDLPAHCIECEPNLCFPECNQHPILALKVYDDVHGTSYYNDVHDTHLNWYLENDIIDQVSHDTCAVYLPLTGVTIGPESDTWDMGNVLSLITVPVTKQLNFRLAFAAADGWTMTFMHAWQKDFIENHYYGEDGDGGNRENRIDLETGKLKPDVIWNEALDVFMLCDQLSLPLYAMLAGEVGDMDTRDALLEQCAAFFHPTWTWDGAYQYPIGPIDTVINLASEDAVHFASSPTGPLAAIARSNPEDGLLKLHGEPFSGARGPIVENININKTDLKRAIYDSTKDVLIVSTDAGTFAGSGDVETFTITRIDPDRIWHLRIDDTVIGSYAGVTKIEVAVPLDGPHDIVFAAE